MTLGEIRDTLLSEHVELRAQIARVHLTMQQWARAEVTQDRVRHELAFLALALHAHSTREERALGGVLREIDAWGDARMEIMSEQHLKEHADLYAALSSAAASVEPAAWSYLVEQQLTRIQDHMRREENAFLNDRVLRDDVVAVAQETG
jgi:hypothetical protein